MPLVGPVCRVRHGLALGGRRAYPCASLRPGDLCVPDVFHVQCRATGARSARAERSGPTPPRGWRRRRAAPGGGRAHRLRLRRQPDVPGRAVRISRRAPLAARAVPRAVSPRGRGALPPPHPPEDPPPPPVRLFFPSGRGPPFSPPPPHTHPPPTPRRVRLPA